MTRITRSISIEELVRDYPGSVSFLIRQDLPCLVCGEPSWGTLEDLGKDQGLSADELDRLIETMNMTLAFRESP
jgi:hypothetical protein